MRFASPPAVAAGFIVGAVFVGRAASGVPAIWSYADGRAAERAGRYAEAGPKIDRGAIGANRLEALWRAGRTRLEFWGTLADASRKGAAGEGALRAAAARFLEARTDSPATGWFIAVLGDVYARRESAARLGRSVDLSALSSGPWALLGDDGRIALGLARAAIDREPTRFDFRDQLVLILEENGLREEAKAAMAESARALPDFGEHTGFDFDALPRELVEAFWRASRALDPAEAPFQLRERQLLSLGQLGRRLGHLEEAEEDLRAALQEPGTTLFHAEDAFHLGLVLADRGRFDEAEVMLARASKETVFAPGVAQTRARIAERQEHWVEALAHLRELRRLRPRDVEVLIKFAAVAQKVPAWDQAEEALRWAILLYPSDPEPRRALVEMFRAKGEIAPARRALDDYVRSFGNTPAAIAMEQALDAPLDPAGR